MRENSRLSQSLYSAKEVGFCFVHSPVCKKRVNSEEKISTIKVKRLNDVQNAFEQGPLHLAIQLIGTREAGRRVHFKEDGDRNKELEADEDISSFDVVVLAWFSLYLFATLASFLVEEGVVRMMSYPNSSKAAGQTGMRSATLMRDLQMTLTTLSHIMLIEESES